MSYCINTVVFNQNSSLFIAEYIFVNRNRDRDASSEVVDDEAPAKLIVKRTHFKCTVPSSFLIHNFSFLIQNIRFV